MLETNVWLESSTDYDGRDGDDDWAQTSDD